jgi:hypothetical protein
MGVSRKNKQGHLDDLAAAVLLQHFLDELSSQVRSSGAGIDSSPTTAPP